jgi:hypothetical protein
MSGNMDLLQFYDIEDEKVNVRGFAVVSDMITVDWTEKQLLVYSVYGYENLSKRIIVDGFKLLMEYAAGQGCSSLVAYTNLDGLVRYVKRLGGSADYTFIRMEVDK